jgi:hypothetical protein
MSRFRWAATAGLAIVAGVTLAACGTSTIDNADLETKLRDQLSQDAGVDPTNVKVSCPSDQEAKKGNTFNCDLTAPNGDKVVVKVTLTNDEGGYNAEVVEAG